MAKQGLSLKLEPEKIDELKKIATEQNKTVTDILIEGIFQTKSSFILENQVKELQQQIQELSEKFTKATGKKLITQKRVSIPLTQNEFDALSRAAFESKVSKSAYLRKLVIENKVPVPELN